LDKTGSHGRAAQKHEIVHKEQSKKGVGEENGQNRAPVWRLNPEGSKETEKK